MRGFQGIVMICKQQAMADHEIRTSWPYLSLSLFTIRLVCYASLMLRVYYGTYVCCARLLFLRVFSSCAFYIVRFLFRATFTLQSCTLYFALILPSAQFCPVCILLRTYLLLAYYAPCVVCCSNLNYMLINQQQYEY